jgi:hypothetical protein
VASRNDLGYSNSGSRSTAAAIPAAAYIGIAFSQGTWSAAWNGSQVLIVNILCVVGVEVMAGTLLRNRVNLRVSRPIQSRSA